MWHKFWLITKKKKYYDPKVYIDPKISYMWFSCSSGWITRWYGSVYGEMELKMDCPTLRILLQKASSYKSHFCTILEDTHAWRYCFRLWVFPLTGEYFYFWHWGVLLKVKRRPHDTDPPHFRHSHPFWNFDYSPVNYDLETIKKELFPRHRLKAHTTEQV